MDKLSEMFFVKYEGGEKESGIECEREEHVISKEEEWIIHICEWYVCRSMWVESSWMSKWLKNHLLF